MMHKMGYFYLVSLLLIALLLSACTGTTPPTGEKVAEAPIVEDSAVGADPASVDEEAGETGEGEPLVEVEPQVRQPRDELEATDPSSVVLASGQPQIVEFFAFW